MKGVFGLSLPNGQYSEVVRGAVQSVPTAQWEAESSFSRRQILWQIILPRVSNAYHPG